MLDDSRHLGLDRRRYVSDFFPLGGRIGDLGRPLGRMGTVALDQDHPGFADPVYRARRDAIAAVSAGYRPGRPHPRDRLHRRRARGVADRVGRSWRPSTSATPAPSTAGPPPASTCPPTRCRSWPLVTERLRRLTGFAIAPVPGLVPVRTFYGSLAERRFLSTQYVRHPSVPLYTPEPDIIHEVIGHANFLASERMADLYQAAGQASRRTETDAALDFFSRVFWFSIEFGVLWEGGELRTYGSGHPVVVRASSTTSARPRSGRSTSGPWGPRPTTSPCTSRCCSPPGRSTTPSTSCMAFFTHLRRRRVRAPASQAARSAARRGARPTPAPTSAGRPGRGRSRCPARTRRRLVASASPTSP